MEDSRATSAKSVELAPHELVSPGGCRPPPPAITVVASAEPEESELLPRTPSLPETGSFEALFRDGRGRGSNGS